MTVESVHAFTYAGVGLTGLDEYGTEWTVTSSSGWTDGAPVRTTREARSGSDGEWDSSVLRSGREVVLTGRALALTHSALELSGRRFSAVPGKGELSGDTDGLVMSGAARLIDAPRFEHTSPEAGTWQLSVVMADPLLYGSPVFLSTGLDGVAGTGRSWPRVWPRDWGVPAGSTPGSLEAPNAGTAPYWPRLRIDGPVPNPVVTLNETGDFIRYNGTLTAGQYLDVDCANRRVLLNGQVSKAPLVSFSGGWLAIPVGGGSLSWDADAADPAASLSVFAFEGAWL